MPSGDALLSSTSSPSILSFDNIDNIEGEEMPRGDALLSSTSSPSILSFDNIDNIVG